MNRVIAIIKKELSSYFNSPIAYIFISVFLVISSWIFFRNFFLIGQVTTDNYFYLLPWIFLFIIPATTMRLWAEEKKNGTMEILLTWPVSAKELVLGKFFASLIFIIITLLISISLPISLSFVGNLDWGIVIVSYLGAILLAAALLAIGLFISSLSENQIIAFIAGVALSFVLFIIGENIILFSLPNFWAAVFSHLGLGQHFASISRGVIDSRDIIYYLSIIIFFLFLNTQRIRSERWK